MKIRVIKILGHEVLRIETHDEVTVSDVVSAMLARRAEVAEMADGETDEEPEECECCGGETDIDDIIASRFSTMTERLVWDTRTDDYPEPDVD